MNYIPDTHLELIDGPYIVALSTLLPDGQPQTTPVWCNRKDDFIFINVMKGFRKEKNMRLNPRVSLLAYDRKNPLRNIEIRGTVVEMTEEGQSSTMMNWRVYTWAGRMPNSLAMPFLQNCRRAIRQYGSGSHLLISAWKVEELR